MKPATVFFIILLAVISYSFFDQYLKKENLPAGLQLQENKPLTATVSNPIKSNPSPNPSPNPKKEEVIQESTEQTIDTSPFYGKVRISGLRAAGYYRPSLITLTIRPKYGEKINMTGWKIKARKGEIIIPQGIEKYQSHRTPSDIIIKESTKIYLINDSNPLGRDKNFRLNKCFGYIKNYHDFYPSFYSYCSKPSLEEISHLSPYCQEFILRLPKCEIPDYLYYSDNLKIVFDMECRNYMDEMFNYRSCFKNHSKDDDFLKNYWYIYTNTDIAHELHDTIYLYDQNGLLVDKYLY